MGEEGEEEEKEEGEEGEEAVSTCCWVCFVSPDLECLRQAYLFLQLIRQINIPGMGSNSAAFLCLMDGWKWKWKWKWKRWLRMFASSFRSLSTHQVFFQSSCRLCKR